MPPPFRAPPVPPDKPPLPLHVLFIVALRVRHQVGTPLRHPFAQPLHGGVYVLKLVAVVALVMRWRATPRVVRVHKKKRRALHYERHQRPQNTLRRPLVRVRRKGVRAVRNNEPPPRPLLRTIYVIQPLEPKKQTFAPVVVMLRQFTNQIGKVVYAVQVSARARARPRLKRVKKMKQRRNNVVVNVYRQQFPNHNLHAAIGSHPKRELPLFTA